MPIITIDKIKAAPKMKLTDTAMLAPRCFGCKDSPGPGALCLAHRNRNAWGLTSGRGIKNLDPLGAILCQTCHTYADGEGKNDYDWWELAHLRTLTWWLTEGHITESVYGIKRPSP